MSVDPNLQAMWDALGILGFDLDGQPTPAATLVSGEQAFREHFIRSVRDARDDHDTAIDEVCMDPSAHTPAVEALRGKLAAELREAADFIKDTSGIGTRTNDYADGWYAALEYALGVLHDRTESHRTATESHRTATESAEPAPGGVGGRSGGREGL